MDLSSLDIYDLRRFFSKIEFSDNCWIWKDNSNDSGYGRFYFQGKIERAHRISYSLFVNEIPNGMVLDHLCRNRICVNPSHLEIVTVGENVLRGESPSAFNLTKTHCPNNHPLIKENLVKGTKYRKCKICHRDRERKRREILRTSGSFIC